MVAALVVPAQTASAAVVGGAIFSDPTALRENDETLLRIESASIHDQYRSNFWALRAAAS